MYPEHAAAGDVADLPVHDVLGRGGLPGRARAAADPRLPQLHRAPSTSPAGSPRAWRGRPRAAEELALLAPRALLGLAKSRFSEQELRRAGCRRTAVVPVLADYRRVTGDPRRRGWRPSWPGCGPAAAPTSSSSGGSCPPRPSTSWSRRCGPTAASTTAEARLHLVGGTSSFEYSKALLGFVARPRPVGRGPPDRARCPTRRWPPTSAPPTSTSRCRRTRGSGCRWSRRWWPGSRW